MLIMNINLLERFAWKINSFLIIGAKASLLLALASVGAANRVF